MKRKPNLDVYQEDRLDGNRSGEIYLANESRFSSTHFSNPLSRYAVGWQDRAPLAAYLEWLAPAVPVSRMFEFKVGDNKDYFMVDDDDERVIGGDFKRVEVRGKTALGKTKNRGLTMRVDKDEVAEEADGWQERKVGMLLQRLNRSSLKRTIGLLQSSATAANKVWGADSNPDNDLRTVCRTAAGKSGIRPNRIGFPDQAWDIRAGVYEGQNTPYAGRAAGMSPEELARKLGIESIKVFEAMYQSSLSEKSKILGQIIYFYAESGLGKDDASNIKRFVTNTDQGRFKVYIEDHPKYVDITVEYYEEPIVTSTLGLYKSGISES